MTPGQIIDYRLIREAVLEWVECYDPEEIAFDPWGATQLAVQLQDDDHLTLISVQQSVKNFSESMKEVEALIIDGRIHHEHSPLWAWMFSNVTARVDKNDNVFPNKEHAENKIDGPVAAFLAMNRALVNASNLDFDENDSMLVF